MFQLKKKSWLSLMCFASFAWSGAMGPKCQSVDVTTPCPASAWDLGLHAMYLKPSANASLGAFSLVNQDSAFKDQDQDWEWGFHIEASRHYGTGNDLNVEWFHFNSGESNFLKNPVVFINASAFTPNGEAIIQVDYADIRDRPVWDSVNIAFGQQVDFGESKFARLHAGINYSRVGVNGSQEMQFKLGAAGALTDYNLFRQLNFVFNGAGPRVGLDLNYESVNHFSVYGKGAIAALVGTSKASVDLSDIENADNSYGLSRNITKVVGAFDAKLGGMYTYDTKHGPLSIDVGWVWAYYKTPNYSANSIFLSGQELAMADWGIQGLYFGLKWIGNV